MWATLEEFANWYQQNGYPLRPPFEDPVYVTDISYSYVLFREGCYQAELYLVRPNTSSGDHSHPGVENIIMVLGGEVFPRFNGVSDDLTEMYKEASPYGTNKLFGLLAKKLTDKDTHALAVGNKGGAFISFEKWPEGYTPTSVTVNWEGDSIDPEHAKIIKKVK